MRDRLSVDQICRKYIKMGPGAGRYYKRRAAKSARAQARRDPENAPTKYRYSGWCD